MAEGPLPRKRTYLVPPGPPMTIGSMREHGVRSLDLDCVPCGYDGSQNADELPDDLDVQAVRALWGCPNCGNEKVNVRPNWREFRHTPEWAD